MKTIIVTFANEPEENTGLHRVTGLVCMETTEEEHQKLEAKFREEMDENKHSPAFSSCWWVQDDYANRICLDYAKGMTGEDIPQDKHRTPELIKENEFQAALSILGKHGVFTEMYWTLDDVQSRYEATDDQARQVLRNALDSEYLGQEINEMIDNEAISMGLAEKESRTDDGCRTY